jgi:hypothetical protein
MGSGAASLACGHDEQSRGGRACGQLPCSRGGIRPGQARANSGVYLQGRYEIQVLDSFGDTTLANDEAGAIYSKKAPDSNAATAPQTWQTYEITFRAARFNGSVKTENARVTVVWNAVTVQNDAAIHGPTTLGDPEWPSAGPIRLQDHGNPVRYRNIWIEPTN